MLFAAPTIDALMNINEIKCLISGLVIFNPPFQGVCAMITPFNFPAAMIARKVSVPLLLQLVSSVARILLSSATPPNCYYYFYLPIEHTVHP